ncbi:MAG: hypothetical protein ACYTBS_08955, partial [Planctomycetota bacterium]
MKQTIIVTIFCVLSAEAAVSPLTGTKPLQWPEEDLSERLMDGAHSFIERQIKQARTKRAKFWQDESSIGGNRQRLRQIIGAVDRRLPAQMERFGDDVNPALVAETTSYCVYQVRWPVLDAVFGEGLLVEPKAAPAARVVVVPDADQTPEQLLGLARGIEPEKQFARRLAENGFELVIPALVNRAKLDTDDSRLKRSDQTYREWIYRQAFHMGRHIIGYEVQKVLTAVDWFEARYESKQ